MTYKEWFEQLEQGLALLPHMTSDERAEYKGALRKSHTMLKGLIVKAEDESKASTNPDFQRAISHWIKTNNSILQLQEQQLALLKKYDRREKEERIQLR